MTESEQTIIKLEPFLTIKIREGDSGARIECPEFGIGIGTHGDIELATEVFYSFVYGHAASLIRRVDADTAPEDTTPEEIATARRILEAKEQGIKLSDLFRKDFSFSS